MTKLFWKFHDKEFSSRWMTDEMSALATVNLTSFYQEIYKTSVLLWTTTRDLAAVRAQLNGCINTAKSQSCCVKRCLLRS